MNEPLESYVIPRVPDETFIRDVHRHEKFPEVVDCKVARISRMSLNQGDSSS